MDSQRFDELTRAFGVRRSRRAVLRTALGGMGAGLLALVGGTHASARVDPFNPLGEDFDPLGKDFNPLVATPTLCGQGLFLTVCGSDEFCCNESCGICAPIGGSCTQEFCGED